MMFFYKLFNKWLLASLLAFTPSLGLRAISEDLPTISTPSLEVSLSSSNLQNDELIRQSIRVLLVNHTIYFHDLAFAVTQDLPSAFFDENLALLSQNTLLLGDILYPGNFIAANQFEAALGAYNQAGVNYVTDLNAIQDTTDPVIIADLEGWLLAANELAAIIYQFNPHDVKLSKLQNLFTEYTLLQSGIVNSLVLTPTNQPDFTGSSFFYEQARILAAQEIANQLIKVALSNR